MPEKLPPASGQALKRLLRSCGLVLVRQRGSHAHFRFSGSAAGRLITVPMRRSIGKKTLDGILDDLAFTTGIPRDELVRRLRKL